MSNFIFTKTAYEEHIIEDERDIRQWVADRSGTLNRGAYNPNTSELLLEFKGNKVYLYSDVPEVIFDRLVSARAPGTFFNREIVSVYSGKKLVNIPKSYHWF